MGRPKKIVDAIVNVFKTEEVKVEVKNEVCPNCNNSGSQCSTCSPVFKDTFGE